MLRDYFANKIADHKKANLYRKLVDYNALGAAIYQQSTASKKYISFNSNDYLGLAHNPKLKKAAIDAIKKYGLGSTASRYVVGNNILYKKLEKKIAQFKSCEDSMVFSSGYQAAIGVVSALVGESDLVVADKLIHSCLLDAIKVSAAKLIRFRHNNIKHCEEIISSNIKKYQKILIITEDIFSMDGDKAPLDQLTSLAQKYNAMLLLDSAHDLYTKKTKSFSYKNIIFLEMATFSKALGSFGGYIAGDKIMIDYLRNFARSAIYTTALPSSILAASLASLQIVSKKNLGQKALDNATYFCDLLVLPKPQSAIVVIVIGDNKKVLDIAKNIKKNGFLISAIRPPTVDPKGARLRITFSAIHKKSDIKKLAELIKFYV